MTEKLESKNRRLMAERLRSLKDKEEELESKYRRLMAEILRSFKDKEEKLESKYRRLMAEILRSFKDKEEELESKYRHLMAERRTLNDTMSKLFPSLAERNAKEREKCEPEDQSGFCQQCRLVGYVQSQTVHYSAYDGWNTLTKGGSDGQGELRWKNPQVKSPDVVTSESGTNTDSYEEDAEADRVRDGFNRGMIYIKFNRLEFSGFSGYRSEYGKEKKTQTNGVGDKTYGNVMKRPWDWEREKGEAQNERKNTSLQSKRDSDSYSNPERLLYWVGNEQSETVKPTFFSWGLNNGLNLSWCLNEGGIGGQCESIWEYLRVIWQSKVTTKNDPYEEDSESGGSEVKSPDIVTSESETNKDLYEEDAEAEIRELEQLLMCKVCLDKDSCIVFFPCRHMATCESCESFLQRCPVCRSQINEAVRINED